MALQELLELLEASMALREEQVPPSTKAAAEAAMPSAWGNAASLSPSLSNLSVVQDSSTDLKMPKNCFQDLHACGIVGPWMTKSDLVASSGISVCSEFLGSWCVAAVAALAIP